MPKSPSVFKDKREEIATAMNEFVQKFLDPQVSLQEKADISKELGHIREILSLLDKYEKLLGSTSISKPEEESSSEKRLREREAKTLQGLETIAKALDSSTERQAPAKPAKSEKRPKQKNWIPL